MVIQILLNTESKYKDTMNCIIPGANIKVVAKTLNTLAKIGDDLFLECKEESLVLLSMNKFKTVCARCKLLPCFFNHYDFNHQENALSCKIQMKNILPVFKGNHLEKKFDSVKIEFEPEKDFITLKIKHKPDDVAVIYRLRLEEPETLSIGVNNDFCNTLNGSSGFFNELLNMFSNNDEEITLKIEGERVIASNYCKGLVKGKTVRSQVNLNSTEFNVFRIKKETTINFSLKPLRSAISFADSLNLNIMFNFEVGGKPLVICIENPTFELNFIVATLDPNSESQSTCATSITAKVTTQNNITLKDQEAMRNEDWGADFQPESGFEPSNPLSSFEAAVKKGKKRKSEVINDLIDQIKSSGEDDKLEPTEKIPNVFSRCLEPTFYGSDKAILVLNSDSE